MGDASRACRWAASTMELRRLPEGSGSGPVRRGMCAHHLCILASSGRWGPLGRARLCGVAHHLWLLASSGEIGRAAGAEPRDGEPEGDASQTELEPDSVLLGAGFSSSLDKDRVPSGSVGGSRGVSLGGKSDSSEQGQIPGESE